jgi:hypothetical protein
MNPMGLLMALMEPEAGTQDEFDDWYDLEHIPHMSGVAGILTAERFVAVEGWPRYAALYDLDSVGVLTSAAYRAVTGRSFSPWSRRILQRVRGWRRLTFEQREPGRSPLHPAAGASRSCSSMSHPALGRWRSRCAAGLSCCRCVPTGRRSPMGRRQSSGRPAAWQR